MVVTEEKMEEADQHSTDEEWKRLVYSIVAPILAFLAVCAVLVNVYVLLSGLYLKRSASINLWFSLSLAAVDTFSATMIVINLFLQSYSPIVLGIEPDQCLRIASEMFRLGWLVSSVLHLLVLAFTHFLGVVYPLRQHSWIAPRKRRVLILIIIWTFPLVSLLISMSAVPGQAFLSPDCANLTFPNRFTFRITVSTGVALPMVITFIFYFAILWKLREADRDPVLRDARPTRHNKRLLCTMMLLMGTFVIGWCPSVLLYLLYCDDCSLTPDTVPVEAITIVAIIVQLLIISKLFSNPLIYALRIGELRSALCQLNIRLFGVQLFTADQQSVCSSQQRVPRYQSSPQGRLSPYYKPTPSSPGQSSSARRSPDTSLLNNRKTVTRFE